MPFVTSSFLLLVAMPGATSSFRSVLSFARVFVSASLYLYVAFSEA